MKLAKIQMIPSVAGIASQRRQEREQEGERPEDEDEERERDRDRDVELADLEVLGEDRVEVVLDRRLAGEVELGARDRPAASRIASVRTLASAGASSETISAVTTSAETGWARRRGPSAASRCGAPRPGACAARPSSPDPRASTTRVNEPVGLLAEVLLEDRPRARAVSVLGSVKRFVSRSEAHHRGERDEEHASQTPSTASRCRSTKRVQRSIRLAALRPAAPCAFTRGASDGREPDVRAEGERGGTSCRIRRTRRQASIVPGVG